METNNKKINVLLTGAGGTVGSETLKMLALDNRFSVTVFDLRTIKNMWFFKKFANIKVVYGDIRVPRTLEQATKNIDVAIHAAAVIPPLADKKPHLSYQVNVGGTQKLLAALEKNSPHSFFIYTSSISVYGDRVKNPFIKVTDPLQPSEHDYYAETKIEAERAVQNSNLAWTIFRLTAIMGYRNHKISGLMFEMPLETSMEIATPKDTARALVNACLAKDKLKNKIFNLAGGRDCRISYRDFLTQAFKVYGLGKFDLPEKSFAQKNFHCGYYADGDELEKIVHFQKDSIPYYFAQLSKEMPAWQFLAASAFKGLAKPFLLWQSLPYKAYKTKDPKLSKRFFHSNV